MNDRGTTIVLIAPTRKRKDLFDCGITSEPIRAACPDPIPGRKEQSGAASAAASDDFINSIFGRRADLIGVMI